MNRSRSEDVSGNIFINSVLEILEGILDILTVLCLFFFSEDMNKSDRKIKNKSDRKIKG